MSYSTPDIGGGSTANLYNRFANWTNKHEENAINTQNNYAQLGASLDKIGGALDSIYNNQNLTDAQKGAGIKQCSSLLKQNKNTEIQAQFLHALQEQEIGLSFDFMEGKDINNEEDYNAQINTLAYEDILANDKDNDQEINFEEFLAKELGEIDTESEEYTQIAQQLSENFASIDTDNSGKIDKAEMAAFYAQLDEQDGAKDGKISIEQQFEEVSVTVDKWDKSEKYNNDCPSRLIKNMFGVSLYTPEGQQYFNYLQSINPDLDLNHLMPGMKINLIAQ